MICRLETLLSLPKKSGKKTVTIVVIVAIIILAFIFIPSSLLSSMTGSSTSTSQTTQSNTLLSSGTVEPLSPSDYYVNFTLPSESYSISLSESYTSNNNEEIGVLTATQFGAFTQNPFSISSAVWYSGDNDDPTISFIPSPGTSYSLVIYNANAFTSDTVTVVKAVNLTYIISS